MSTESDEQPGSERERDDLAKRQASASEGTYRLLAVLLGAVILIAMFVLMASQSTKF